MGDLPTCGLILGQVGRVGQVGQVGKNFAIAEFMALKHHTLVAWQRADDLFIKIHALCQTFPAIERYELSSQARRSAYSVAANIVEGFGRRTPRDRLHFLHMAEASLAEVGYWLHVARRLGYTSEQAFGELEVDVKKVGAPLSGLIGQLSRANRV